MSVLTFSDRAVEPRLRIPSVWPSLVVVMLATTPSSVMAERSFITLIPNGDVFSCQNCHDTLPNLNRFGRMFSDNNLVWDTAFSVIDSDVDGFSNGQELRDPAGLWRRGDPQPGDPSFASNPGDSQSIPVNVIETPVPTPTPTPTGTRSPTPTATVTTTRTPTPSATAIPSQTPTPAAARQLFIVGDAGAAGETLSVLLAISDLSQLTGGNITLHYDENVLTPGEPEVGAFVGTLAASGASSVVTSKSDTDSLLRRAFARADALQTRGPGALFTIPFSISPDAPSGATVLSVVESHLFDGHPRELQLVPTEDAALWVNGVADETAVRNWASLD